MSYPGSHQQFGLSDLELLQQQLMLARLQGLQKQQQLGQFSDGKPSNLPMSMLASHPGAGQFSNQGGTLFNASGIVASSNLNWMHQSVSSSMQEMNRGFSNSHGEGLIMNPSVQQPDMSLHGATATSGRGNLGHHSPIQGVSYSSEEKPIAQTPALANSFFDDKHSVSASHVHSMGGSFMLRQGLQDQGSVGHASIQMLNSGILSKDSSQVKPVQKVTSPLDYNRTEQPGDTFFLGEKTKLSNDSRGRATLDPLEEKILFDTEDNGWNTSCSKLAALGTTEFVNASSGKEYMNSFPCIQSGSWSALMQSAVAEASSSETGMQEELSGLSFQNTESSVGKQPLNFLSNDKQSTSDYLRASGSSVDSMKPQHSSRWPNCQPQQLAPDLAGHSVNDSVCLNNKNVRDICQGSRSSGFSVSGTIRHDYEFNQQAVDSHRYMPFNEDVIQKDYKSTSYDHQSRSNPMAVDMLYKRAAEIYGNPNHYRGENSCDSYTSKLSQTYVAQASQACLNAEDSESSARSSHKSQNQTMCISSPGGNSQQECFSHLKSANAFPTNTNLMIKGRQNLLADSFLKGSPASDMSASFDSQYTSEHDKESQPRDQGNAVQGFNVSQTESQEINVPNIFASQEAAMPDRFCSQSSMSGDLRLVNLGYVQKGQTWWTPSSFGHSFSPLQGASTSKSCAGKSNVYGKTAIETSNLESERNSLESFISSLQPVNKLIDRKVISRMSDTSESIHKTVADMSQQMSLPGFSPTQDAYHFKNANSFDCDYNSSGVLSVSQSDVVKGTYHQDVKPLNVQKHMRSQKDSIDRPSSFGLPPRILAMVKDSSDEQKAPVIEHVAVVKDHGSAENYLKISSDASAYAGSSISSGMTQRSLSETTLRAFPTCSQSQVLRNVENVNKQLDIADANMNEVGYNSAALYNLNKQWLPDIIGQQPVSGMHKLFKNHVGSQSASCSSGDNSTNVVEVSTQPSALQHMYSYKVPMLQGYSDGNVLYDRMRHLQMRAQSGSAGYVQNEYIKNREMFSLCDSAALASIKPYDVEFNGTDTHVNGADVSNNYELLPGLVNQMANSEPSLPSSMPLSDSNVHLVLTRPKKRKTAMYNCLPWYKEVMTTHHGLLDISAAEEEWAEATNRLTEKHVDEDEKIEEKRPIVRAKRRLIATTELMQLVFRPPPSSDLTVDARIEYEIVVYSITKLVVADACGLSNIARADYNMPQDIGNINGGMANRLSDKATELLHRTKELEIQIERSSKGVSIVDILIECQELEKIGIINHFAKYRRCVPESASTSTGLTSVRPFLERYVRAIPLPGKLPEGIQCLSL